MKRRTLVVVLIAIAATVSLGANAQNTRRAKQRNAEVKNIIIMIGDGMGVGPVAAAGLVQGFVPMQIERAQYVGLAKTYSANNRVTDSAAGGTALATGYKSYNNAIGVDTDTIARPSTREKAELLGYATGVVTDDAVTCATPAAFVAHVDNRSKEPEIALQYLEHDIDLFIGGGMRYFNQRADSIDLVAQLRDKGYIVADCMDQVEDITHGRVAAMVATKNVTPAKERTEEFLPLATAKALEILSNNAKAKGKGKGFFVMIEAADIDHTAHSNDIEGVLAEMREFDKAIGLAFDFADRNPGTLVVVTADHDTGGLSLPSGKTDFNLAEQGVRFVFGTTSHSALYVPIFAYGTGAEQFKGVMENTEIARLMQQMLK